MSYRLFTATVLTISGWSLAAWVIAGLLGVSGLLQAAISSFAGGFYAAWLCRHAFCAAEGES